MNYVLYNHSDNTLFVMLKNICICRMFNPALQQAKPASSLTLIILSVQILFYMR